MATQANARTLPGLVLQTTKALAGVRELATADDLSLQGLEAVLESGLTAANRAVDDCSTAKAALSVSRRTLKGAKADLQEFVSDSISLFKVTFGLRWNGQWEVLNLPVGSVTIPKTKAMLLATAQRIQDYLTANPSMESEVLGVTEANAAAKIAAFTAAEHGVDTGKAAVRTSIATREEATTTLGHNLRSLRTSLEPMADDDPRWNSFGYDRPCDPTTPEIPAEVRASKSGEELTVSWSAARRADRYKVYVLQKDVDQAAQAKATTPLTEASIGGLVAGAQYVITVTAVNAAGESQPSTPVELTF